MVGAVKENRAAQREWIKLKKAVAVLYRGEWSIYVLIVLLLQLQVCVCHILYI